MTDPKEHTEEETAPVLNEDQAEPPQHESGEDDADAIETPIEEGQFDAQPGA